MTRQAALETVALRHGLRAVLLTPQAAGDRPPRTPEDPEAARKRRRAAGAARFKRSMSHYREGDPN